MFACPVCQSLNAQAFVQVTGSRILKCQGCELVFTDPSAIRSGIYGQDYFTGEYETDYSDPALVVRSHARFTGHLALIRRFAVGRRLLDVGCALGLFLQMAREAGFEVSGFDVSEYAAAECHRKLKLEAHSGDLVTAYAGRRFDIITLFHVLEHISDPVQYLEGKIKPLMNDHGVMVIEVPNLSSLEARCAGATWIDLRPDQHAIHYTPDTLRMVLGKAGFRVLYQSTRTWLTGRTGLVGACAALIGHAAPRLKEPGLRIGDAPTISFWFEWKRRAILTLRSLNRIMLVPLLPVFRLCISIQGAMGLGKNVFVYAAADTADLHQVRDG